MKSLFANGNRNNPRLSSLTEPSDSNFVVFLLANTSQRITLPTDAVYVNFTSTDNFWSRFGDSNVAVSVPGSNVLDGSAPELNPASRTITPGVTHVSLVSPVACTVVLSFFGA